MRVLIVDDHDIVRMGLRATLQGIDANVSIAEAGTAAQAMARFASFKPDIILLDIHMPGMSGLELVRRIHSLEPGARMIVIAAETDPWAVKQALGLGALGFVSKTNAAGHLKSALQQVQRDLTYLCPDAEAAHREINDKPTQSEPPGPAVLSAREQDVLKRIAQGQTTKAIAASLGLSPKTVETHRVNILRRLQLDNVQDLTRYAIRHAMIAG